MTYTAVRSPDLDRLITKVNMLMKEGWIVTGNLVCCPANPNKAASEALWVQPMINGDAESKPPT